MAACRSCGFCKVKPLVLPPELQRWPEPGAHRRITLSEVPSGTVILGMAPIGVRWAGICDEKGVRPERGCPRAEFAPCFAVVDGEVVEIA